MPIAYNLDMQRTISIINLTAIISNAQKVRSTIGTRKFYAVVKADAYGHGSEEVARAIENIVDGFCVAIVEEGITLRVAGITKEILVLTPPLDSYDVFRCRQYNLTVTVNSMNTVKLIDDLPCQIKINTGMNRCGCLIGELKNILNKLKPESILGVYSHLFAPENNLESFKQLRLFSEGIKQVKTYAPRAVAHISASGGILKGKDYLFDGVRCGLLLYGYVPKGFSGDFTPALKVYARRIQITPFIGGGVGYNVADRNYSYLSTYRLGYADGFFRGAPLGEKTLCMDSFISTDTKKIKCILDNAQEYADECNTIPYEILTKCTLRSERIYER